MMRRDGEPERSNGEKQNYFVDPQIVVGLTPFGLSRSPPLLII
jgi:hypothetical protein